MNRLPRVLSLTALLFAACHPAYADRAPLAPQPVAQQSPYRVELVGDDGGTLNTYGYKGRWYVEGDAGERYSIRISNPTARRVEAVISVDGLDVVDGQTADFVNKRGYIVPPYGELVLDGFRVSMQDVAAFRFSAVASSYAARKGKGRNVGVIGVALFAEKEQQPIYMPPPEPYYDYEKDDRMYEEDEAPVNGGAAPHAEKAPSPPTASPPPAQPNDSSAPARPVTGNYGGEVGGGRGAWCCKEETPSRPGLGTEFGERRSSNVQYVSFVRENQTKPTALAELRYNDHDGLVALGIPLGHPVNSAELELRETANPFPQSNYASPPPGWR